MTPSRIVLLCSAALFAPGAFDRLLPAVAAQLSVHPETCELAAVSLREKERLDAQAAFWRSAAEALNGPATGLLPCLQDAWLEYQDAIAAAQAVFDARLAACADVGHGPYIVTIAPAAFSLPVTNPWFPLVPGRVRAYEKHGAEGLVRTEVTVLSTPVTIAGVACVPVRSVGTRDGTVTEETIEYHAQHASGAVWVFGSQERFFDGGFLDGIDGSWRAGRDGAQAGIQMPASPTPGVACRMGYHQGDAEDIIKVVALNQTVVTAAGTFTGCVQVEEYSPLEDEREMKYFAPGIGLVLEVNLATGERNEIVATAN